MVESYRDDFVGAHPARRDELERALRRSTLARVEHRYVKAVELARDLIVGLDADGAIRLFNREAERVTGYARDEVLGASFVETLSAGARSRRGRPR